MKYRKTALIEAEQYIGSPAQVIEYNIVEIPPVIGTDKPYEYFIPTLEGPMELHADDWIATGVNGEHWAIADDIFKKTYEAVKYGCKYCQRDEELMQTESGALIIINNKLFEIVAWDDYNDQPSDKVNELEINYCPMCGRRLSNE